MSRKSPSFLMRPSWLLALAVLVLNDHFFKGAGLLPAVVTGKLSDFAGMYLAPALFAGLVGVLAGPRLRPFQGALWAAVHVAVGLVFAAIQLSSVAASSWSAMMGLFGVPWAIWSDPSDLLALPILALSYHDFRGARGLHLRGETRPETGVAALGRALVGSMALLACLATSPAYYCEEQSSDIEAEAAGGRGRTPQELGDWVTSESTVELIWIGEAGVFGLGLEESLPSALVAGSAEVASAREVQRDGASCGDAGVVATSGVEMDGTLSLQSADGRIDWNEREVVWREQLSRFPTTEESPGEERVVMAVEELYLVPEEFEGLIDEGQPTPEGAWVDYYELYVEIDAQGQHHGRLWAQLWSEDFEEGEKLVVVEW